MTMPRPAGESQTVDNLISGGVAGHGEIGDGGGGGLTVPRRTHESHQAVANYISGGHGGLGGMQGGGGGGGDRNFHGTVNNYIFGGVGGNGGSGGILGGTAGTGKGPTMNYDFAGVGSLTMNHHGNVQYQGESGLQFLHRIAACDAFHNSADRFPQPKCHPKTREEMLGHLLNWTRGIEPPLNFRDKEEISDEEEASDEEEEEASDEEDEEASDEEEASGEEEEEACPAYNHNQSSRILWLHGPAGAGKSAIAQSLCQKLEAEDRVAASFFFKRGHPSRGNARRLFTTIAYQLAARLSEVNSAISHNVINDPAVVDKSFSVQLEKLIIEPCRLSNPPSPPIIIIDGLDECESRDVQKEILFSFANCILEEPFPVYLLIASRPEPHISETFQESSLNGSHCPININQSFEDVRNYLRAEFTRIHTKHRLTMATVPSPWPSSTVINNLVKKSSGYFIYASTIIRFIDDEYSRPSKQLDIIQSLVPWDFESPFKDLDQLYIQILQGVPDRHRPHLCDILSVILNFPTRIDVQWIEALLGLEPGNVSLILRPLYSVLKLPSERDQIIDVHHASFRDFLNNKDRSSDFYVGSPTHRANLARSILKALAYKPEDPQRKHVDWEFTCIAARAEWIAFIASVTPSADFVPFLELVNPDFVFFRISDVSIERFLIWLKGIQPVPESLISRWEDYRFMHSYQTAPEHFRDDIPTEKNNRVLFSLTRPHPKSWGPSLYVIRSLHSRMNSELQTILEACRELLLRSPQLIRIFQAARQLLSHGEYLRNEGRKMELFCIRMVLDLSWDEIQECICSLRPLVTQEPRSFPTVFLFLSTLCRELGPEPIVARDLARGSIRLMHHMDGSRRDTCDVQCGRYIRSSPLSDPEILQELQQLVLPWDGFSEVKFRLNLVEFYDVVQWLKASPNSQPDLIARWQSYLTESMVRHGVSGDVLESRWRNNLKTEADFYGPPQAFEEDIIKFWERWLKSPKTVERGMRRSRRLSSSFKMPGAWVETT
ncbi:hypothetical protein B0H14DRAFT_2963909 [Mycena olivaceomarginata]|nr:hypothetical protein B0H14DRAFT_2963909 [Mycena olivaceomarginata]